MKKQFTFILSVFTLIFANAQSITTVEGVYGGRINAITGGKIGVGVLSDSLRIIVATESANSMFYADVKSSAFGSISTINSFKVLPSADATIGLGSNIRRIAYHKESETIFFVNNGNLYATNITASAATAITTGGGIVDVKVHNDNLYYLSSVGSNNTFYYATLSGSGVVSAVSNTTVASYAFTALVEGKDDKLYAFKEGTAPKGLRFGGDFSAGIDFATTTTDAMAVLASSGNSWSAMGVYSDGTVYVGGTNGGTNPYKYVANTSTFGTAFTIVNTNITGTSGYNIEFRTGTFGAVYVYFGSAYSPSGGALGSWVLIGNTGFETHPNDGSVFLLSENNITNKGNILMTTDQGLGLSENSGATIREIDDGILATQVYDFDLNKSKSFGWLAGKDGVRYVSDYSGAAKKWSTSIFPNGDGSPYFSAEMVDDSTTAYVGNVRLYRTSDKGTTWSQIFTAENAPYNYPQVGSQIQAIAVSDSISNIVMIGYKNTNPGQKGGVFYTLNGGSSWQQLYIHTSVDGQDVNVNDIEIVSDSGKIVAYIGVDYDNTVSPIVRGMYKAQYDGTSWTVRSEEIYSAASSLFSVVDIVIPNKDTILATGSFYNPSLHHDYGVNFMISRPVLNTWHHSFPSSTRTSGHTACSWNVDTFFYAYTNSIYYEVVTFGPSSTGSSGEALYSSVPVGTEINVLYYDELLAGTSSDFRSIKGASAVPNGYNVWTASACTSSWTNIDNWSLGRVPVATDNVTIGRVSNNIYPVLASSVTVKNLTFDSSTTITTGGPNNLNITGDVTFSNTQLNGNIVMSGSSAQSVYGIAKVNFFTVNNTAGVSIVSGSNNKLSILNQLNLTAGTLHTNSNITLKSTSLNNSAIIGPVAQGANVDGNITVERFIPKGFRSYRDLCANGVYNPANTLFNTWQENGSYSNNGYGMFITGVLDTTVKHNLVDAINGIDHSISGYSSAYYYKAGWDTVKNTKTTALNPYQSYRVLVRGDRSFDLDTTPLLLVSGPSGIAMHNSTTLRTSGAPIMGTVTCRTSGITNGITGATYNSAAYGLNSASNGYTYLANPYACPIIFDSVYDNSSNIKASYYYINPTIGSTGAYVSYNAASGVASNGSPLGKYIQAGQGFLIGNNSSSPVVVFKESYKAIGANIRSSVFGTTTDAKSMIILSLLKKISNVSYLMDGAVAVFGTNFSNSLGVEDNIKMNNAEDNLSILEGGNNLSIDGRLPATTSDILGLNLSQMTGVDYQIVLDVSSYTVNGVAPYLYDAYKKNTIPLLGIDTIDFNVDTKIASSYQNRFSIIFQASTLPVSSITAIATPLKNLQVEVKWSVVGKENMASYSVERSFDGVNFNKLVAVGSATSNSYKFIDENAFEGINYYRIKSTGLLGDIFYSNVVKLITHHQPLTSIKAYPNPLVGRNLQLAFEQVDAGIYTVVIYNKLGQRVFETIINHSNSSSLEQVILNKKLASEIYSLHIVGLNGKSYKAELVVK